MPKSKSEYGKAKRRREPKEKKRPRPRPCGSTARRRAAAKVNVLVHPAVRQALRAWSVGWCIGARPSAVKAYADAGYLYCIAGSVRDFAGKTSKEKLYKLTRLGMRVAYPDGAWVQKYECVVCGKVTAGRMSRGGTWFPRKHGGCSGYAKAAHVVPVHVTY